MHSTGRIPSLFFALSLFFAGTFASASNAKDPTTLLFLGDSLTAGYGVKKDQAYPNVVAQNLKPQHPNLKVVNGSISGSLASSGPTRLKFYLNKINPDIVVIALGGNDARQATDPKVIKKHLSKTIELAKEHKVKVVLAGMKIFVNYGKDYGREFSEIYPQLAKEHQVALIEFLLEGVAGKKDLNQADGFHPNAKGHSIMAQTVTNQLKDLL